MASDSLRNRVKGRTATLILTILVATAAHATIEGDTWLPIGPAPLAPGQAPTCGHCGIDSSGRASALAVNPSDPDDIWLGTSNGGVWHSVDGGSPNSWKPMSDYEASLAIGDIALDGCNPQGCDKIYAGTGENAIRRDTYYGAGLLIGTVNDPFDVSWTLSGQAEFEGGSIPNVVLDPSTNGGSKRIYVTLSSGVTASSVQATLTAPEPAGGYGIYRSEDDGGSWTKLTVPSTNGARPTDLDMHPQNSDLLLAGFMEVGLFKGTRNPGDGTVTWCPQNPGVALPGGCPDPAGNGLPDPNGVLPFDHVGLAIWDDDPNVMYASFGHCPDPLLGNCEPSIYRTTDGGATWDERYVGDDQPNLFSSSCPRQYSRYTHGIAIDPNDSDRVYLSGLRLCRSINGGTSWGSTGAGKLHYDLHDVVFPDPADSDLVYTTSDGGFAYTINGGVGWGGGNVGLQTVGFQSISFSKHFGADEIIGGTQDNGPLMWTGGSTWERINGGDSGSTHMDFDDKKVFYDVYFRMQPRRSDDFGGNWASKETGIFPDTPSAFYPPLEQDATSPYPIYLGSSRLYRSWNQGDNWSPVSPVIGGNEYFEDIGFQNVITAIAIARTEPNRIYLGFYDGQVWRTADDNEGPTNAGSSWQQIDTGLPGVMVTDLEVDSLDEDRVFVTFSGFDVGAHVYRTLDGGSSWAAVSGPDPGNPNDPTSLPDIPANVIRIEPADHDRIWLGTDRGVYKSLDAGATWERFGTGMPNVPVYDLEIDNPRQRVFAATHGRGAFFLGGPNLHTSEAWTGNSLDDFGVYGYGFPAGGNCTVKLIQQDGAICAEGSTDGRGNDILTDDDGKLVTYDANANANVLFAWGCWDGTCIDGVPIGACDVPGNPVTSVVATCGGKTGNAQIAGCPIQANPPSTIFDFDGDAGFTGPDDFVLSPSGQGGGGPGGEITDLTFCTVPVPATPGEDTMTILSRARDLVNGDETCQDAGVTADIQLGKPGEDAPAATDTTLVLRAPDATAEQLFSAVQVAPGALTGACFSVGRLGQPLENSLVPTRLKFLTGSAGAAGGSIQVVENALTGTCSFDLTTRPGDTADDIVAALARESATRDDDACPASGNPRDLRNEGDAIVSVLASRLTVCVNDAAVGFAMRPANLANVPPVADAGGDRTIECTGPAGTPVTLDGSASTDPDSSPGTNDDIVSFDWFENFGDPTEVFLGFGELLGVNLTTGEHKITLRVTDSVGNQAIDTILVDVADTTPPDLSVALSHDTLYPPNHRFVPITAAVNANDTCGATQVWLSAATSDEPDDAPGTSDGATTNDVRDADVGLLDLDILLRAERDGLGAGRTYEVRYVAQDQAGNQTFRSANVFVPIDQNGRAEPLASVKLERTPGGTVVSWGPIPGALHYNVLRGDLGSIVDAPNDYELGPVTCIEAASLDTVAPADPALPAVGKAFFYLVEYDDGERRGYGTVTADKPRTPGAGDCP